MAEKAKEAAEADEIKTKKVEIIKFHPLIAHEVGETPILTADIAEELIEKGYAKAAK